MKPRFRKRQERRARRRRLHDLRQVRDLHDNALWLGVHGYEFARWHRAEERRHYVRTGEWL